MTCIATGLVFAQDADAIMQAAKDKMGGFGSGGSMGSQDTIVVTDKNGRAKEPMLINQYSMDNDRGNAQTMIEFGSPAAQKGTRFLTIDNGNGGSDQWIYLPSLGKTRRIASSESGGSFMGTDFSYDDMSLTARDTDDDTKQMLSDKTFNGIACYVIQATPKDSGYQYQKMLYYVGKSDSLIYKIELYKKAGDSSATKVLELSNYKNISGHMTPQLMKISTIAAGTSTTITMNQVQYDMNIPPGVFSTNYLSTGKY
jgi:hypothetical protein